MPRTIFLDTGVLSNCVVPISASPTLTLSEQCRRWLIDCEHNGADILVPSIAYYETLREIERRQAEIQRKRLVEYCFMAGRFIPVTTRHLEEAARLWAHARLSGAPTANDAALDGDMILCAQVLSLKLPDTDYIVATTNTKHLKLFVQADDWQNIQP